jgi:hypothetical protein
MQFKLVFPHASTMGTEMVPVDVSIVENWPIWSFCTGVQRDSVIAKINLKGNKLDVLPPAVGCHSKVNCLEVCCYA